ncbi:MAG: calcium/sodium antiporter [Clostridia bacterium]|nr:calcium/sodium antiporter [Clostridia bacterium]
MLKYVLLIVGFVLLIKGADFFVDGASNIAKKFNISPLIIGLTIVAFGTSLPEASVSISASLAGSNQLCLSNVVGSNIFNLLVVVGACVLFKSMAVDDQVLKRDFPITIFATFILWFMSINMFDKNVPGTIKTYEGLILFVLFLGYMIYTVIDAKKNVKPLTEEEKEANKKINIIKNLVLLIIGLCGIVFGGNLVVDSATKIAISFGVSEAFIGLTIVAMGTSLPELVTSLVALGKGSTDIAIGNVIGSNLFNILFILGASTALSSVNVEEGLETDIIFLLLVSVVSYVFGLTDKKITRFEGVAMLLCYFGYIVFMLQRAGLINIF